jgi:hypothetical protein
MGSENVGTAKCPARPKSLQAASSKGLVVLQWLKMLLGGPLSRIAPGAVL